MWPRGDGYAPVGSMAGGRRMVYGAPNEYGRNAMTFLLIRDTPLGRHMFLVRS